LVKFFYFSEEFRLFISTLLKVEDLPGTAVLMLPLGFSIAAIFNGLLHWIVFEKRFKGFSRGVIRTLFEGLTSAVVIGITAYVGLNIFVSAFDTTSLLGIFLQGFVAGVGAIGVGILTLTLFKSRELKDVWSVIKGRFWKAKVIATDPEIV